MRDQELLELAGGFELTTERWISVLGIDPIVRALLSRRKPVMCAMRTGKCWSRRASNAPSSRKSHTLSRANGDPSRLPQSAGNPPAPVLPFAVLFAVLAARAGKQKLGRVEPMRGRDGRQDRRWGA